MRDPNSQRSDVAAAPAEPSARRTATAEIRLRADGIVSVRVFPGARQTVADARENFARASEASQGERRPILVDICGCEPLESEVRRCYTGEHLAASFSAIAMLVEMTTFGRMIGNIYLEIAAPGIPARIFVDEARALAWLRAHGADSRA